MRIVIHENEEKTKFFRMATLFAKEYNQHVPTEERARITLPYSFVLSKLNQPFPEMVSHIVGGSPNNKFAKLVRDNHMYEKGGLFDFQFTRADQKLYKEIYSGAVNFIDEYKRIKQVNDSLAKPKTNGHAEAQETEETPPPLSANTLRDIRERALHYDKMLAMLGIQKDGWFEKNGLGKDEYLPELSNFQNLSKPAIYLAMLQSPESRKQLGISEESLIPSTTSAEGKSFHTEKLPLAGQLIEQQLRYQQKREASHSRPNMEKMRGKKREEPNASNNQMREILSHASDIAQHIQHMTPEMLNNMGISKDAATLSYEGAEGAALLHALCRNSSIRQKIIKDSTILQTRDAAMEEIAMQGKEETLFATDNVEAFNQRICKPKEERIYDMSVIEGEYETALQAEIDKIIAEDKKNRVQYNGHSEAEIAQERKQKALSRMEKISGPAHVAANDTPAQAEVEGLTVCDSGALYNKLKKKLEDLKDFDAQHQERDTLKNRHINKTLEQMQDAIRSSGHGGATSSKSNGNAPEEKPQITARPEVLEGMRARLERTRADIAQQYAGEQDIPKDVEDGLSKLMRKLERHIKTARSN